MKLWDRVLTLTLIMLVISLLSGCANFHSIDRISSLSGDKAIHLDAEQRLVYAGKDEYGGSRLCAEPSPDAIMAFSSTLGRDFSAEDKKELLSAAFAKSSGYIGLRTQSIQLMRDALYRACEAYFNKAITEKKFVEMHEQFQDILVGALAIEQLTGAVVAPAMSLVASPNSSTSTTIRRSISDGQEVTSVSTSNMKAIGDAIQGIVQKTYDSRLKRKCISILERGIALREKAINRFDKRMKLTEKRTEGETALTREALLEEQEQFQDGANNLINLWETVCKGILTQESSDSNSQVDSKQETM